MGPPAPAIRTPAVTLQPLPGAEPFVRGADPGQCLVQRRRVGEVDPVDVEGRFGEVQVGVGQARDGNLGGFESEPPGPGGNEGFDIFR